MHTFSWRTWKREKRKTVFLFCYRGSVGKSKGLTFLIWDVGGQEKIRPLWRSYTRWELKKCDEERQVTKPTSPLQSCRSRTEFCHSRSRSIAVAPDTMCRAWGGFYCKHSRCLILKEYFCRHCRLNLTLTKSLSLIQMDGNKLDILSKCQVLR